MEEIKENIGMVVFVLILFIVGIIFFSIGMKKLEILVDKTESIIGEKVLLEGDTLMIIDWKIGSYVLSDGREVNQKLIPEIIIK